MSGATTEAGLLGIGVDEGAFESEGVGVVVGDSVESGDLVSASGAISTWALTVPRIGLRISSASERGVIAKTQRTTRPMIMRLIVVIGVLAISARVIILQKMIIFGRVLPEQIGYVRG
jgi:hypothetical protein